LESYLAFPYGNNQNIDNKRMYDIVMKTHICYKHNNYKE